MSPNAKTVFIKFPICLSVDNIDLWKEDGIQMAASEIWLASGPAPTQHWTKSDCKPMANLIFADSARMEGNDSWDNCGSGQVRKASDAIDISAQI